MTCRLNRATWLPKSVIEFVMLNSTCWEKLHFSFYLVENEYPSVRWIVHGHNMSIAIIMRCWRDSKI